MSCPALTSVAVHLSPERAEAGEVEGLLAEHLTRPPAFRTARARFIEIGVSYGGADGPDLAAVAEAVQLEPDEVVRRHCAVTYHVFMLGFLPGFPYLGPVDPSIHVPRLAVPRTRVPGRIGRPGWTADRHLPAREPRRLADHRPDLRGALRCDAHAARPGSCPATACASFRARPRHDEVGHEHAGRSSARVC